MPLPVNNYTDQQYYDDQSLHGSYQYVTLKDVINTFIVRYVGDNQEINNVARHRVIFEAKQGLRELKFDVSSSIRRIEIELDDNLEMTLPPDFVSKVRLSWVDDNGNLRPIPESYDNVITDAYLQDNEFNILYDSDGYALFGTSVAQINEDSTQNNDVTNYDIIVGNPLNGLDYQENYGGDYNLETNRSNINGWYAINDRKIRFNRNLPRKNVVLEYVSDGINLIDESLIRVHKFAEKALYSFIKYSILNNRLDSTEYRIRRAKKDWLTERQNAKIRLSKFNPQRFLQRLKGRRKWVK